MTASKTSGPTTPQRRTSSSTRTNTNSPQAGTSQLKALNISGIGIAQQDSYTVFFVFSPPNKKFSSGSFFQNYYCPVKTFSYGFREAGPLCEIHCKPPCGTAFSKFFTGQQYFRTNMQPISCMFRFKCLYLHNI